MSDLKKIPVISTVKVVKGNLYLPLWLRKHFGIKDDDLLEVYGTDEAGEITFKRRTISKIVDEQIRQAETSYTERAIRAMAKGKAEDLDKLHFELDEVIAKFKNTKEGKLEVLDKLQFAVSKELDKIKKQKE